MKVDRSTQHNHEEDMLLFGLFESDLFDFIRMIAEVEEVLSVDEVEKEVKIETQGVRLLILIEMAPHGVGKYSSAYLLFPAAR